MANHSGETPPSDDFLDQILGFHPGYGAGTEDGSSQATMMLQLGSGDFGSINSACPYGGGGGGGGFPLGLSLEHHGIGKAAGYNDASGTGKRLFRDDHSRAPTSSLKTPGFQNTVPSGTGSGSGPHQPAIRPRIRARRGQATDPHSIAERLRRERIAERVRALQELVPSVNKTDKAVMVDEIVDYVKFLRLQVKVLSMSRLGGAGAVVPLATEIPIISSVEEEGGGLKSDDEGAGRYWSREKWPINVNDDDGATERQVAKLMMEDKVGAAMQFLQSKALCIMPLSFASAIYHTTTTGTGSSKPETSNTPPPSSSS